MAQVVGMKGASAGAFAGESKQRPVEVLAPGAFAALFLQALGRSPSGAIEAQRSGA
jgi:hypothetical protein